MAKTRLRKKTSMTKTKRRIGRSPSSKGKQSKVKKLMRLAKSRKTRKK